MDILYYLFGAAVLTVAMLAAMAIKAPRPARGRFVALILVTLFVPIGYAVFAEMLSRPKPVSYEWFERTSAEAVVLGVHFDEGKAIYLWLSLPEGDQPRYYRVPWNIKLAEKLEEAAVDAVRKNALLILRNPFQKRGVEDWGDLNVEIKPPPVPLMKRPVVPPRIIDPRELKI